MLPLSGVRVVDLGDEAIVIEPPSGSAVNAVGPFGDGCELGGLYLYLNNNKRIVAADFAADAPAIERLVRGADAIISSRSSAERRALGLDAALLGETNPTLVDCTITPFGLTGRRKDWKSS